MRARGVFLAGCVLMAVTACSASSIDRLAATSAPVDTPSALPSLVLPTPLLSRPPVPSLPPLPTLPPILPSRSPAPKPSGSPATPDSLEWRFHYEGFSYTVTRNVLSPRAGQLVRFVVRVTLQKRMPFSVTAYWGDNMGSDNPTIGSCEQTTPAGPQVYVVEHAWRVARSYPVTVYAGTCRSGPATEPKPQRSIRVRSGPLLSNGPQLPWAFIDFGADGSDGAGHWHFAASSQDNDGWVRRLVWDWGDGSTPTTVTSPDKCFQPHDDAWTESRPSWNDVPHTYVDDPENYVITVTAYSTGCSGHDEQHWSTTWRPRDPVTPTSPAPRP